jgi:hypothetical protein
MLLRTFNAYSIIQGGQGNASQAAPAAATTSREAQRQANKALADQIREQVRASVTAATQARADAAAAQADAAAAQAAGITAPPTPPDPQRTFVFRGRGGEQTITMPPASEIVPPQVVDISIAFFIMMAVIIIGLPLARAFARRMDRKSGAPQMPSEVSGQLAQLNQAVDAIALEVERISEGQRFTTRLLSEQRDAARQALPSAADR